MLLSNLILICSVLMSNQDTTEFISDEIIINTSRDINKTIINNTFIENSNKQDLSSLLNGINGISLKNYGGAGGMQMISLRASNSSQIAYIIDGFKINDKSTGSFNSSLFNINNISEISIEPIGNSSKYGSNSLFGNINIKSKLIEDYNFNLSLASFDNYKFASSIPLKYNSSISVSAISNQANYPINFNNSTQNRLNSNLNNYDLTLNKYFISDSGYINIKYILNYQDQGVPGPVINNRLENTNANLTNINNYFYLLHHRKYLTHETNSGYFYSYSDLSYKDTLNKIINSNGINNNFYTHNAQTFFEFKFLTNYGHIETRFDSELIILKSNSFNEDKYANITGLSASYFRNINKFNIYLSSRFDYVSYTNNNISSAINISFDDKYYSSKLSYSRNFRAPSFNEMYYLNYGNSNLIPEISNTINLNNKFTLFNVEININPYFSLVDDYIISIPISPVLWSAQNLEKVNNYGVENNIKYSLNNLSINFNYTYQKAIFKQKGILFNTDIPYIPNEIISLYLEYRNKLFNVNMDAIYNSFRYYNQGSDPNSVINPFTLVNINLNKEINLFSNLFTIYFSINNIFNEKYQYVINYPMPGINYNLSFRYKVKK